MEKKLILGLCTSGSRLLLSVSAGGRFYSVRKKEFNQERVLFPLVRRELRRAGGELRSLDAFCASRGPGRFTGLRIALTFAGALKALAGTKIYTATLFEILALEAFESPHFRAWRLKNPRARLAVLLRAFKDEYFCQFFRASKKMKLPRAESAPVWLKDTGMKSLLAEQAGPFYAVADEEEAPGIYSLLPAGAARAPGAISRTLGPYIIKAALAYGKGLLKPLYLKPAKYELENKQIESRKS